MVQNVDAISHMSLTALNQEKIGGRIPRVESATWVNELKKRGTILHDVGNYSPEIELIIGADSFQGL